MYQSGKFPDYYTWKKSWEVPYESLWGRSEKIRAANCLEPNQMDKLIRQSSNTPMNKLVYVSEHAIFRNRKYSIIEDSVYTLDHPNEMSKQLLRDLCLDTKVRYCAQCMKYGYHSLYHQARFLDHCFLHENTRLEYRCNCKGTYVMMRNSNDILIFQCPICKIDIPAASITEGILGAWDKSNITPLINEWESDLPKHKLKTMKNDLMQARQFITILSIIIHGMI